MVTWESPRQNGHRKKDSDALKTGCVFTSKNGGLLQAKWMFFLQGKVVQRYIYKQKLEYQPLQIVDNESKIHFDTKQMYIYIYMYWGCGLIIVIQ